jgi:hypothetical protein
VGGLARGVSRGKGREAMCGVQDAKRDSVTGMEYGVMAKYVIEVPRRRGGLGRTSVKPKLVIATESCNRGLPNYSNSTTPPRTHFPRFLPTSSFHSSPRLGFLHRTWKGITSRNIPSYRLPLTQATLGSTMKHFKLPATPQRQLNPSTPSKLHPRPKCTPHSLSRRTCGRCSLLLRSCNLVRTPCLGIQSPSRN